MTQRKKLAVLFFNMLYISTFTFGGGFVIASMAKKRFVDKLGFIEENEMLDYIAIAQSCPGAIAVNVAILIGRGAAGFAGMIAAVLGTVIPPIVILCIISVFYTAFSANRFVALVLKGMQAGVAAVIFDVVCSLAGKVFKSKSALCIIIMFAAFAAVVFFNVNVILIIAAAFLIGVAMALAGHKKEAEKK